MEVNISRTANELICEYDSVLSSEFINCAPLSPYLPLAILCLITAFLFYILAVTADEYLCANLIAISRKLGLSDTFAGVTLVAFGNGAPDIFSAISGIKNNRPSLVFSQLFGSGAFVTAMVTGIVMCIAPPFTVDFASFSRDIVFYLSGSIFTIFVFYRSKIHFGHALAFIGIYCVYIGVVALFNSYWSDNDEIEEVIGETQTLISDAISQRRGSSASSIYNVKSLKNYLTSSAEIIRSRTSSMKSTTSAPPTLPAEKAVNKYGTFLTVPNGNVDFMQSVSSTSSDTLYKDVLTIKIDQELPTDNDFIVSRESLILAELLFHILPYTWQQIKESSWFNKCVCIASTPLKVILNLTIPVVDIDKPNDNWCKILNSMQCLITPILVMVLYNFVQLDLILLSSVLTVSVALCIASLNFTSYRSAPRYNILYAIMGFCCSTAWIYITCELLVSCLNILGAALGISDSLLGLTVLSWGNSMGDLITDVAIAKHGMPSMAVSAAFGGTMLDLFLGLGIPYCILLLQQDDLSAEIDFTYTIIPLFVGFISLLVLAYISLLISKFRTSKVHAGVLIGTYIITIISSVIVNVYEDSLVK